MSGSTSLSPVPSIDNCDAMNLSIVSSESDDLVDDDDMDESSSTPPKREETEEDNAREETHEMEAPDEDDPDEDDPVEEDPDEEDPDEREVPRDRREEAGERFIFISSLWSCVEILAPSLQFREGLRGGDRKGRDFSHPNVTR